MYQHQMRRTAREQSTLSEIREQNNFLRDGKHGKLTFVDFSTNDPLPTAVKISISSAALTLLNVSSTLAERHEKNIQIERFPSSSETLKRRKKILQSLRDQGRMGNLFSVYLALKILVNVGINIR